MTLLAEIRSKALHSLIPPPAPAIRLMPSVPALAEFD
jgi:pyrroline-5-carboxylate reductase